MPIVVCPCGKKFRAIDSLAGKQVNCPGCGRPLVIPQASLLDEELARPVQPKPVAAPVTRSRVKGRSTAIEGWLLVLLLAGGGAVVFAIIAVFMSMIGGDAAPKSGAEPATNTPARQTVAGASIVEPSGEPAEPAGGIEPELESMASTAAEARTSPGPPADAPPDEPASATTPADTAKTPIAAKKDGERSVPAKAARPATSAQPSRENTVRLSMGVALAQTLPTGTAMGFSVDYQLLGRPPTGPAAFVWVIESGKGQVAKQPVQLSARGTLQGFFPQFRPEHGPFSTHIEDRSGNRLSKSLRLR